ncbi:hypothetical protein SLEP1_g59728 [Rubroshorea leprosula]|uniref:Uncharacterized protein n=1 Tax=Rubroshorea leprosula TaxID=152421 RepID=A0AAV5MWU9_9ROSI|nr:hypothetical protein SLEP1_g59728 [Rubroshorea leprosula]
MKVGAVSTLAWLMAERALPLDFFYRRTGIDLLLGTFHR